MVRPRIFQFLDLFAGQSKQSVVGTSGSHAGSNNASEKTTEFIERRKNPDRRLSERRKVNCHPYLDTRSNNGRRRSFGRRSTDEKVGTLM